MFLAARKAVSTPAESIKQIEKDWRLRTRFIAFKKLRATLSLEDFSKLMFSLPLAEISKALQTAAQHGVDRRAGSRAREILLLRDRKERVQINQVFASHS